MFVSSLCSLPHMIVSRLLVLQTSSPRTNNFQHCNKCQSDTEG
jgi:hypothetical protein